VVHKNYFVLSAETYFELGVQLGETFGEHLREAVAFEKEDAREWRSKLSESKHYLAHTNKHFPHFLEELKGYAHGAGVAFEDLWVLSMEDELDELSPEKCTTMVTNEGLSIAHNEDWDTEAAENVCILKKTIGDLTILELFYLNTLGGNAISVNSNGITHAINTLTHSDYQVGIPRTVIARWLSETNSPDDDLKQFKQLRRSTGFHHTLLDVYGRCWSVESSANKSVISRPELPFVHTNHYLSELQNLEDDDGTCGSFQRYDCASTKLRDKMTLDELKALTSDASDGMEYGLLNERTIARMLVDIEEMTIHIWLRREKEAGWLEYPLDFMNAW